MNAVARVTDVYRKNTATPAGCVRASQAGTKLDRTQTAEDCYVLACKLLIINIYELLRCKLIKSHDFFIGARGVSGTAVTAGC